MRSLALWNATLPATGGILPSQLRVEQGGTLKLSNVLIQLQLCSDFKFMREAYCSTDGGPPPYLEVGWAMVAPCGSDPLLLPRT